MHQPDRGRGWLLGVVFSQWLMANGHQLWPLGVALQVSFLIHLAMSRSRLLLGFSDEDRAVPLGPPALALLASLAVVALSPLGPTTLIAPLTAVGTVLTQGAGEAGGAQANELRSVLSDPIATAVAVVCVAVAAGSVARRRSSVAPFDVAVWLMGLALVALAVRGIPFLALATGGLASRALRRAGPMFDDDSPVPVAASGAALVLALGLLTALWKSDPSYYALQRGLGRSVGEWGDATVAFLRDDPPPGRMLNLGWVGANPLIFGLAPEQPVFVDPRWESYPRAFLLRAIAAQDSDDELAALLDEYRPGFVVAEMRLPQTQERAANLVRGGGWAIVHADSEFVVLAPAGTPYAAAHRVAPADVRPVDLLGPEWPILRAQQQVRVARLLVLLGERAAAEPLLDEARRYATDPMVALDLAAVPTGG